ncbi:MAG: bifunctional methylenetetrahydrofolate dehydrogenase/methenyltetrahydrofolate cyclohydrolase FolD [Clostridiales bacterium]|nr:bifunctional methylenetetrahydrofolate dehydrogenase/methenyltetrahydrofolate cyclohydrolase FolD [Clostridiales bacterium]
MAHIIDGKAIAKEIREEIKAEVEALEKVGLKPGLAVVIVGEDPASQIYVGSKEKACKAAGILSEVYKLPESAEQSELLELVEKLNKREDIHGILVQLPLPKHMDSEAVIEAIDPSKDVDAFSPVNVGRIMIGQHSLAPCTPAGIIELIKRSGVSISGKRCVVIGRSNIVGKPVAMLLLHESGTVTICHSRTANLQSVTQEADILIAAIGKPKYVTADMVKPGACVIDVGVNRLPDGKVCGDVDFDSVSQVAGYITPVPGGVGPMTISMLLKNTVAAAKDAKV